MIKIELRDGTVLDNDPLYGWNLSDVSEIQEVLTEAGCYRWQRDARTPMRNLYPTDVKRIYEA